MGKITLHEETVSSVSVPDVGKSHIVVDDLTGKVFAVRNNGSGGRVDVDLSAQVASQYALYGTEQAINVANGSEVTTTVDTWNVVPMASELIAGIGGSILNNEITLPAGTYRYAYMIRLYTSGSIDGYSRLYKTTNGAATIPYSLRQYGVNEAYRQDHTEVQGQFTLGGQETIRLEYMPTNIAAQINRIYVTGLTSNPDNLNFLLSHIHLWKIAEV